MQSKESALSTTGCGLNTKPVKEQTPKVIMWGFTEMLLYPESFQPQSWPCYSGHGQRGELGVQDREVGGGGGSTQSEIKGRNEGERNGK